MADDDSRLQPGLSVPSSRIGRLSRFGGVAGGIAGRAAVQGVGAALRGERPQWDRLLLTPGNVTRLTDELARMRGAAMKLGQLLSMDTGELLPPELTAILARLRAEAHPMPPRQLRRVLDVAWGRGWLSRFRRFDVQPIAAASIGQVHRAVTRAGRELAVKIQYPGVRRSIDSDVDNVAGLIRLAGVLPRSVDIGPLLAEAKRQLHEEADYRREADCMARFHALLADDGDFAVPEPVAEFTTDAVLAMDFLPGRPIETLRDAPQATRDRAVAALLRLALREVFEFRLIQSDPNFANYRVDPASGRLVLLDFGATRSVAPLLAERCRAVLDAALAGERGGLTDAVSALGVFEGSVSARQREAVMALVSLAALNLRREGPFDFASSDLTADLRHGGLALATEPDFWPVPPAEVLFLQRKLAGLYLLGARLAARVDLNALVTPWASGAPETRRVHSG